MQGNVDRKVYVQVLIVYAATILVFAVLYAALAFVVITRQSQVIRQEKVKVGKIAVDHFVNNALSPLVDDDLLTLNVLLKQANSVPGLRFACISDQSGKIKAHSDPTKIGTQYEEVSNPEARIHDGDADYATYVAPTGERIMAISRPVTLLNETLAYVHAGLSLSLIDSAIIRERSKAVRSFVGLGLAIAAALTGAAIASVLLFRAALTGRKEESAQEGGQEVKEVTIGLSVPMGEGMRRNQVSVLFVDIKGFRAYAEKREPNRLQEDLGEYLSIASDVVRKFGGHLDKLVGDAIIAVFGNSPMAADHAETALNAAIALQDAFNKKSANGNGLLSKVAIGISSGIILSGVVGSGARKELALIGESFRTAYSLNVLAGAGEIIMSKEAYRLLEDKVSVEPLPPREIQQRTRPWESFRLLRKV